MRLGLVAVGAAVALLGAGIIVVMFYPSDVPELTRSTAADAQGLGAGDSRTFDLDTTPSSHATLSLTWYAAGSVSVQLYYVYACREPPESCITYPAIVTWPGGLSGSWSASGAASAEYELAVEPTGTPSATINFSATLTETYRSSALALPMVPFALTVAGGSVLAGIGGVVLYLGLFLPAGVYRTADGPEPEGPVDPVPSAASGGGSTAEASAPGRPR